MPRPPTRLNDLPAECDLGGLSGRAFGRGPRLVLLHGGPGLDHHLLLPLAVELADSFEVLLPDLPGHGASPVPDGRLLDLEQLLRATARWLGSLEPAPDVLAGHSLGAHLTMRLLAGELSRPRAAVLISPPGPEPQGRAERAGQGARDDEERRLRSDLLGLLEEEAGGPLTAETAEAVARCRLRAPSAHASLLSQLRRRLTRPLVRGGRRLPVLVVTGEDDRIAPPSAAEALASRLANGRLAVVPGAGHWWPVSRPSEAAALLQEFLGHALRRGMAAH